MAKDKKEEVGARGVMSAFADAKKNGQLSHIPDDDEFRTSYPNLWEWMTATRVGKWEKDAASVTMRTQGTFWKATLADDSLGQSCSVVANTLREALARLDAACVHPETAWTVWRAKRGLREAETTTR